MAWSRVGACWPLVAALVWLGTGCGARVLEAAGSAGDAGGSAGLSGSDAAGERSVDGAGDAVSMDVYLEPCGNGRLDPGEECDDGNMRNGDGCNHVCQIECSWLCGSCGAPTPCTVTGVCGDGVRTRDEICDDGNTTGGDGCSADCAQIELGWQCQVPGARCTPVCGDGRVVGGETCDDGNRVGGDGCSASCLTEPTTLFCGDGIVSGAEECDAGQSNGSAGSPCGPDCRLWHICGDGVVEGTEECDNGSGFNTAIYGRDGCTPDCRLPHYCGDGIVDVDFGEQCDTGANNGPPLYICTEDCKIYI
jgi:cysteine-rich repeat protein